MAYVRPQLYGPGVYLQEVPSGDHVISGTATSRTAFLGRMNRGPINTPITISSYDEFVDQFGDLREDSPVTYAVNDFYRNGGQTAIIVRLFKGNAAAATATIPRAGAATAATAPPKGTPAQGTPAVGTKPDGSKPEPAATSTPGGGAVAPPAGSKPEPAATSTPGGGAVAPPAGGKPEPAATSTPGGGAVAPPAGDGPALNLIAANAGKWGSRLTYSTNTKNINDGVVKRFATIDWPATDLFNLTIILDIGMGRYLTEQYNNVSLNPASGSRNIARILAQSSQYARIAPNGSTAGTPADSAPLDYATYVGGIVTLKGVDVLNLMVIPPDQRDGDTDPQVYTAALEACVQAKATLIVDAPLKWGPAVDNIKPENFPADIGVSPGTDSSRFAAVYWPRITRPDPLLNGFVDTFPASGMVAGIMARTDNASGVWTAPAGLSAGLIGANSVAVRMTDQESGYLNSNGVNAIRSFAATGPVLWGARTIRGSDQLEDDYKYLSVRRLTDYIEQTLLRQTRWAVFQSNDQVLWTQLSTAVRGFMADLWAQGALAGGSMDDAYFVRVDASTTTPRDVELGIVNVHIGFAPVRPAEFVILYLQQLAGQSQT